MVPPVRLELTCLATIDFESIVSTIPPRRLEVLGYEMGFEPTTNGVTGRYSNQLSYSYRLNTNNMIIYIFF